MALQEMQMSCKRYAYEIKIEAVGQVTDRGHK